MNRLNANIIVNDGEWEFKISTIIDYHGRLNEDLDLKRKHEKQ